MRQKVLMAIVFASGMIGTPVQAEPEKAVVSSSSASSGSVAQQIANNVMLGYDVRAFYLLKLASSYLNNPSTSEVEEQFKSATTERGDFSARNAERYAKLQDYFIDQVFLQNINRKNNESKIKNTENVNAKSRWNETLANTALQQALTQLEKSDRPSSINLYFAASLLFEQAGNETGAKKCEEALESYIQTCEKAASPVNEQAISAATSVLNLMSNRFIYLPIGDANPNSKSAVPILVGAFSDDEFKNAEKLRIRGVAIADQLNGATHTRRKAHRDLALWYKNLGKTDLADKEKKIVFELVGINDDSILYPHRGGCGMVVWWKPASLPAFACGMG